VTAMTAEKTADPGLPETIEIDGQELLTEFVKVMTEWGHYRTASGLMFPALDEAREVAAGRRADRGWNTDPIPDGCSLFQPR
jgi:hypothetical protein